MYYYSRTSLCENCNEPAPHGLNPREQPPEGLRRVMLAELLERKRKEILHRWVELILSSYPKDSARFLANETDRFSNPVGHTIRTETEQLLRALLDGIDETELNTSLDRIVRIRTVQEFSPARAMSFVFLLKTTVREVLADELTQPGLVSDYLEFESRIDGLALQAFNNYMACKEAIYEIRTREARNRTAKLVEQVNRIYGKDLSEPEQ